MSMIWATNERSGSQKRRADHVRILVAQHESARWAPEIFAQDRQLSAFALDTPGSGVVSWQATSCVWAPLSSSWMHQRPAVCRATAHLVRWDDLTGDEGAQHLEMYGIMRVSRLCRTRYERGVSKIAYKHRPLPGVLVQLPPSQAQFLPDFRRRVTLGMLSTALPL